MPLLDNAARSICGVSQPVWASTGAVSTRSGSSARSVTAPAWAIIVGTIASSSRWLRACPAGDESARACSLAPVGSPGWLEELIHSPVTVTKVKAAPGALGVGGFVEERRRVVEFPEHRSEGCTIPGGHALRGVLPQPDPETMQVAWEVTRTRSAGQSNGELPEVAISWPDQRSASRSARHPQQRVESRHVHAAAQR